MIETRHKYPIVKEYKDRNCTIRRRPMNEKSGIDLFILERIDMGMTPRLFFDFQVSIMEFCKANRLVSKVDVIEAMNNETITNYELYAMYIKSPTFLISDRLMVDAKYIFEDSLSVIVSSIGCEAEKEEYCRTHDIKGIEHAVNVISAMRFFPIYENPDDVTSKVIGTTSIFVNESDFGGSIPKWLVQKFVPKSIHELFDDVVITTQKMISKSSQ